MALPSSSKSAGVGRLKQAARLWSNKLSNWLLSVGFTQGKADHCLYLYKPKPKGIIIMMAIVVVDDLLIAHGKEHQGVYDAFLKAFQAFTEVRIESSSNYCGLEIVRYRSKRQIVIRQTHAIREMLREHRFEKCKLEDTPLQKGVVLSAADCPATGSEEQKEMSHRPYREIVGKNLFFMKMTRPDIAFHTDMLARFGNNPGRVHWNNLRWLQRHLNQTSDLGLILGANGTTSLRGIVDATWASNPDDRHSTSGYGFELFGSLFCWWSRTQHLLARSSFEAELIAIYAMTAELSWIRNLLADFDIQVGTIPVAVDNQTTIKQLKEHVITQRTRHIAVRFYSTTEYLQGKIIELVYVPSSDNPADMLTKSLDAATQTKHRQRYMTG